MAERVLEQLGELGLAGSRDRDGALDDRVVERLHRGERRLVDARDDLGRVDERPGRVAGVDALGAVAEVEVDADRQAGARLEDRTDELLGGARVRGRLEDHGDAGPQEAGQRGGRRLDVGEVGVALAQRRGDGDHGDVEAGAGLGLRRMRCSGRSRAPRRARRRDVLDVRLAGAESLHPRLVGVVADDGVADVDGAHRERQPDVALTDDEDRVRSRPLTPTPVTSPSCQVAASVTRGVTDRTESDRVAFVSFSSR